MAAEQGPVAISDLVGAERRAVAEELWQKWRFELNTADTRPPAPRSPEESPYERPAAPRA